MGRAMDTRNPYSWQPRRRGPTYLGLRRKPMKDQHTKVRDPRVIFPKVEKASIEGQLTVGGPPPLPQGTIKAGLVLAPKKK